MSSAEAGDTIGRRSLADQVADHLLDMILSRGMKVDDPLPSTGQLAKQFDVSVVVVREAIAKLAGLEIIERRQGRESVISLPDPSVMGRILRVHAHFQSISIDELQACRSALEVDAAWTAASVGTAEYRTAFLRDSIDGMRAANSYDEFNDHDLQFHLRLAELAGNRASSLMLDAMSGIVRETLNVTAAVYESRRGPSSLEDSANLHALIAEKIADGDAPAAAAAMVRHFTYINRPQFSRSYTTLDE